MSNPLTSFAERAEFYRQLGWPVFPVGRNKHPLENTEELGLQQGEGGFHRATTDGDQIQVWSEQWPQANIAVRTGKASGIVVVDIDGEEGAQSVTELHRRWFRLPDTAEVRTARGRHLYYAYLPVRNSAGKIGKGIDIRGDGGSIVAPVSVHASGDVYEWRTPPSDRLPLLPLWIPRLLKQIEDEKERNFRRSFTRSTKIPDAGKFLDEVRRAPKGQRNHALNRAAYILGRMVSEGQETEGSAFDALVRAGIESGLTKHECRATARSGLRAGIRG